jgi:hypothetical protein
LKRLALTAHLTSHGCKFVREGAKHYWSANPANGRRDPFAFCAPWG